ncbi:MAG: 3'(2'),5'-bisphosphate nucleotidase CysQ [Pseudomonadota bacterium]
MFKDDLAPTLLAIARAAGDAILTVYEQDFAVDQKADASPVTAADRAADALIREALLAAFPKLPVLSEESAIPDFAVRRRWSRYWLVDPLDGTREFVNRNGEFTVNIALIEDHRPVFGVIHAPVLGHSWWGGPDLGATAIIDGETESLHVRRKSPATPTVLTSRSHLTPAVDAWLDKMGSVEVQRVGSSLKFCYLAAGRGDVYPRFGPTSEWDTAAGHAVLRGAGGIVCRWDGTPLRYNTRDSLLNPDFIAYADTDRDWRHV